jgi:futalosine hydrolase
MADLHFDVSLLSAVFEEIEGFVARLEARESLHLGKQTLWAGRLYGKRLLVGATGLGKVNAGIATAVLLERFHVGRVWHVGCAGAFEEGFLRTGDVLVSTGIHCGDEGVLCRESVFSTAAIGIPVLKKGGKRYYDRIPVSEELLEEAREATPPGSYRVSAEGLLEKVAGLENSSLGRSEEDAVFRLAYGPSLTVGMASGDAETARSRFGLHGALAENMEGSGVALACLRSDMPMLECRGISNVAGCRNMGQWRMGLAVGRCLAVARHWLRAL